MKALFIFFSLILTANILTAQEKVLRTESGKDIRFVVRNFCYDFDQVILCNGNDSTSVTPSIGSLLCNSPLTYVHYDSLLMFKNVKYFDDDGWGYSPYYSKLLGLGSDSVIISYHLTYPQSNCDSFIISGNDTILSDSIAAIDVDSDQLTYIRSTYNSDNFFNKGASSFSLQLNSKPVLLASNGNLKSAVLGISPSNETKLILVNLSNQQILKDTILSPQFINPVGIYASWNTISILSCPGDSIINLTTYNISLDTFYTETIWTGSGVNVFSIYSFGIVFQPESDTSINNYDKQIISFNSSNHNSSAYNINKRLKVLIYSDGSLINTLGYNPLIAVEDLPQTNKLLFYDSFVLRDSILTDINPKFFISDFRCALKVADYDDSKVEWQLFPNPSDNEFNLVASGLICGRDYKVDIIDIAGNIKYETVVHAKTIVTLPTGEFPPGFYFVRIHSKRGMVVQKIVKT